MKTYNVHEAKTHLLQLVDLLASREQIIIARNGKPVAELVVSKAKNNIEFGLGAGQYEWVSKIFDEIDPEIQEMFCGEDRDED